MQIESITHLKSEKNFRFAGLDLLPFETSFRRVLVNMIILDGILRISVLWFTHSVFLMNELHIAYAHQLIVEMHCAKNIE
jgi:hypothetical protein